MLQETFLRVWQIAPRIRRQPDDRPDGLLRLAHTTARNLALDEMRRARRHEEWLAEAGESETAITSTAPDPFLRQAIQDCREDLPGQPKRALAARLETAGARSDHELAAGLDMTKNTFLQNFTRARKLLADCLEQRGVQVGLELS